LRGPFAPGPGRRDLSCTHLMADRSQSALKIIRNAGITALVVFLAWLLWVAILGPGLMFLAKALE